MPNLSVFVVLALFSSHSWANIINGSCKVRAQTEGGWVCGRLLQTSGIPYASFQNIPYAKQPLGELRFRELQTVEPWQGLHDATKQGAICPQNFYEHGPLSFTSEMSEACIPANVFVPLHALPGFSTSAGRGLSIMVFIGGGAYIFGSQEINLGPEYLIRENIIIITFNERINVFGYLSLANSASIPGNNGLRDVLTVLRWVKRNARYFGGNPDDITLAGQSNGGANVHLICLSKAAKGLFKRAIAMSGVGIRSFITTTPEHAKEVANSFLKNLNITETDPEKIHQLLIEYPVDVLLNATRTVQTNTTLTFCPVVESNLSSYTVIIDKDPEELLNEGEGKDIPLLMGFTNMEAEFFVENYKNINILANIKKNPLLVLPPDLVYKLPRNVALEHAKGIEARYFNGTPTLEKLVKLNTEKSYLYPAIKLMEKRATIDSAPVYLYEFAYDPDHSAIETTQNISYKGSAHAEDLTFIFKQNALKGVQGFSPRTPKDSHMTRRMTAFVKNFMTCNAPVCKGNKATNDIVWPPENQNCPVQYEYILEPCNIKHKCLTREQRDVEIFFDKCFAGVKTN